MESGNGGDPSEGVCLSVADSSEEFQGAALTLLQSAYLYEESKQLFTYNSASVVTNPQLEQKYNAFRARKRQEGYSEEDLKETYGFLLFDDINKANALGETGMLTGNNDLTILGDPSKGVYISMYSDCLDPNHWCHPKSGYIAIIKLTKGKVKSVTENYTQTLTVPTEGFDCHVSKHLFSVSSQTSSFLAFERSQYYIYEHLHNGNKEMAKSPSAACPFAIISFSYMNSKATRAAHQDIREDKKPVGIYWPWRGQLQIDGQSFTVGLRSKAGALIPGRLPPVVKVSQAILVSDLQRSLPSTGFEACLTGEAFLDGFYCSLFELVSTQEEEKDLFSSLLNSLLERNVALSVPLVDGGFLLLMHSSHLIRNDDATSEGSDVLQSLFVFPQSRITVRAETDFECQSSSLSSEALQFVPALNYGEHEVGKLAADFSEELCDVLLQHMQNYKLQSHESKSESPCALQYDTHLCSCQERGKGRTPQRLASYLSRPASFQLPLSNVSKVLLAGQEEQREDMDEDAYVFPLSSENMNLADPFEMSTRGVLPPREDKTLKDLEDGDLCLQSKPCTVVSKLSNALNIEGEDLQTSPSSKTPPAELIVSITTAEQDIAGDTVRSQIVPENSLNNQMGRQTNVTDFTEAACLKEKRARRGPLKKRKPNFSSLAGIPNIDTAKTNQHTSDAWKYKFRKLSRRSQTLVTANVTQEEPSMERTCSLELGLQPKEKTERQLPVVSQCGRILVPFGRVYIAEEITTLRRKLSTSPQNEEGPEKPVTDNATVETEPNSATINGMDVSKSVNARNNWNSISDSVPPQEDILNTAVPSVDPVPLKPEHEQSDLSLLEKGETGSVQDKPIEALHPKKALKRRFITLAKLRSLLPKRKRKGDVVKTEVQASKDLQTQPSMRTPEITAPSSESSNSPEASKGVDTVSELVSKHDDCETVPNPKLIKETTTELQKNNKNDSQQRTNSRSRDQKRVNRRTGMKRSPKKIKTLKTPPGIPVEKLKHEWWLHCGPSTSSEIETPQNKELSDDGSVSKTADEEENQACSPMHALNLLAELALGDTSNTLSPPTYPAPEQKSKSPENIIPEPQPVVCVDENLRQATPPFRSPSPKPLVSNGEFVAFASKDHIYAMPPSSCSLGATSASPQRVPAVFDAPCLNLPGQDTESIHSPVSTEHPVDSDRTQEYLRENMHFIQKFKNTHVFVDGGSLRVTRQWPEQYDFNLDSRIAIGQKERTIARVLHGPWAFPPEDNQSVRLIIHLWIGLFYSRSTPRLVEMDLDFSSPSVEVEKACTPSGITSKFSSCENMSDSPLDLSRKSNPTPNRKSVIWDHFQPTVATPTQDIGKNETLENTEKKDPEELLNSPQSHLEPHKDQRYFAQSKAFISEIKTWTPTPEVFHLEQFEDSSSEDNWVVVDSQGKPLDGVSMAGVSTTREQKLVQCHQEISRCSKTTDIKTVERYETKVMEVQDGTSSKDEWDILNSKDDEDGFEDTRKVDNLRPPQQIHVCNDEVPKSPHIEPSLGDKLHLGSLNLAEKDLECEVGRCPGMDENSYISSSSLDEDQINVSAKASPASPKNILHKENLEKSERENLSRRLSSEGTSFSDVPSLFANEAFPHATILSDCGFIPLNENQDWEGKEREGKWFSRTFSPLVGFDTPSEKALFLTSLLSDCVENKEISDTASEKSDVFPLTKQLLDAQEAQRLVVYKSESDDKSSSSTVDEKPLVSSASGSPRMNIQPSLSGRLVTTDTEQNLYSSVSHDGHSSPPIFSDVKTGVQSVSHLLKLLPYANGSNLLTKTNLKKFLDSVPLPKSNHMSYFLNRRHLLTVPGCSIIDINNPSMALSAKSEPPNSSSDCLVPSRTNKTMIGLNWEAAGPQGYPTMDTQQGSVGESNNIPSIFVFPYESCPVSNQIPTSIFPNYRISKANFKACKSTFKQTLSKIKSESSGRELVSLIELMSKRYMEEHLTEVSLQQECLVFLDQMKRLAKQSTRVNSHTLKPRDDAAICRCKSLTSNFCSLKEQNDKSHDQKLEDEKTKRTCQMCKGEEGGEEKGFHPQEPPLGESSTVTHSRLGSVIAECVRQFEAALHQICGTVYLPASNEGFQTQTGPSVYSDYCSPMKRKLDQDFESGMNSLVKRSCTAKNRFFTLETAECDFFKEVKAQLEAEGHIAVTASEFFTEDASSSLLIILRNEDIAKHVCEVPHLLQLKKSPSVLFAGIDTPADVVNLTHRELFVHGGFIMIDGAAQEHLSLGRMKKIWEILKELNRSGKWKWMLHHRDSRRLKEDASTSAEAKEKSLLLSRGQDAGLLNVLPYHECDMLSRDQPNYLTCLVHLQVQKISYRHAVFVTDGNHEAMERNGIQTVTMNSFLTQWPDQLFTLRPQAPSSY